MEYFVTGSDGAQYGPINVDTLRQWLHENRVNAQTQVKDFHTGQILTVGQIPGLVGTAPHAPSAPYGTATYASNPYTHTPEPE